MRVFYGCYTGGHLALCAAGFHLGWFDKETALPHIMAVLRQKRSQHGALIEPILRGLDQEGREIYTIGLTTERQVFTNAIKSLFSLYNYGAADYHLIDTSACGGLLAVLGYKLQRLSMSQKWGEAFLAGSVAWNARALAKLVEQSKNYLAYQQEALQK